MGNSGSYASTTDSSSSSTSSRTFEVIRKMSFESDVFYPDTDGAQSELAKAQCISEASVVYPDSFPTWRMEDISPVLLKYIKRSYNPCPENLKNSAKKLAELVAAQKVPKFISTFGGSQCIKLHWACLAGWCMCRYQYQPMTPLHLMPHTSLTCCNIKRRTSLPSSTSETYDSNEDNITATLVTHSYPRNTDYCDDAALQIMAKESTV